MNIRWRVAPCALHIGSKRTWGAFKWKSWRGS